MAERATVRTRVWKIIRYYRYPIAGDAKKKSNTRGFELTVLLEFPDNYSKYDVEQKEDDIIDHCDKIMKEDLWETVVREGHAENPDKARHTWDYLEDQVVGGFDTARGISETDDYYDRLVVGVKCKEPYRNQTYWIPNGAWQEIYRLISRNEAPDNAFERRVAEEHNISRDAVRSAYRIQKFHPQNCVLGKPTVDSKWVVVDVAREHHKYSWGDGGANTIRGERKWQIP